MRKLLKHVVTWCLLAAVAIVNGVVRVGTFGKVIPELAAHQLSTLTGVLATGAVAWAMCRLWPIESAKQAWLIGLSWLALTMLFEFGFGHYVAGHPWSRLLADYDLSSGRVWALFLVWIAMLPVLLYRAGSAGRRP